MEDESNAAERAAKLRAAERAAAQEKAEKRSKRLKKVLGVLILLINIALCVLLGLGALFGLGVTWLPQICNRIAIICFYIDIGAVIVSVIFAFYYYCDCDEELDFLNIMIILSIIVMVVLGAVVLFANIIF